MKAELPPPAGAQTQAQQPELITRPTLAYRVTRVLVCTWLFGLHRLKVEGREHLPRDGPVLLVTNHQSFLDIPLIASAVPRHVSFVARDSLARSRAFGWLMRQCGAVLVRRGAPDRRALREIAEHLRRGDCVSIFPEGTRSPDGQLGEFRPGAQLALRLSPAPLLPAAIRGTLAAWPHERLLPRRRRVSIRFLPPVDPSLPDALEQARAAIAASLAEPPGP